MSEGLAMNARGPGFGTLKSHKSHAWQYDCNFGSRDPDSWISGANWPTTESMRDPGSKDYKTEGE